MPRGTTRRGNTAAGAVPKGTTTAQTTARGQSTSQRSLRIILGFMKRTLPGGQASNKQLVCDSSKHEFEKDVELVGEMSRAGVDIIAGTDVLNPFCFPGSSLADELELYVKTGFSPIEALRTATAKSGPFPGAGKRSRHSRIRQTSRSRSPRGQSP